MNMLNLLDMTVGVLSGHTRATDNLNILTTTMLIQKVFLNCTFYISLGAATTCAGIGSVCAVHIICMYLNMEPSY
jgi:hypothetical protein